MFRQPRQQTATHESRPAVRRLLQAPAHLYRYRVHEARLAAQLSAPPRDLADRQHGPAAGHVHSGVQGHVLSGAAQLHSSRSGGAQLFGWLRERGQGGRLWAGALRAGRPVHQLRRHQVPDQVGTARGAELHAILVEERRVGVR